MNNYIEYHDEYDEDKKDLSILNKCNHDWERCNLTEDLLGYKCKHCGDMISDIEYEFLED